MPRWAIPGKRLLQPRWLWILSLFWIVAIAGVTLFWGLGDIGLIDETEPLFVEAARQMFLTGDWITPYFDGVTRFDKPPLIYWLMVLCFRVFGVSEWAARLPSAFSGLGIAVFCFYVLRQHAPSLEATPSARNNTPQNNTPQRPWLAAWLGATMLMLNLNTYFWGRTGYADMLLTATMGGALLAFFLGYAQPQASVKRLWYSAFYLLIALAILTKGPIALLLPAAIIGGFVLYLGNLRVVLREMQLGWGILAVLVLTLPWYILVTLANGSAFIQSFFGYHNLTRFSSVVSQHSGPWYFHFLVILAGFLPWSAYLPLALFKVRPWQRRRWQQCPRSEQLSLYAVVWFVVILGFFTISVTKYFSYTLPLMPAAAILVALLWTDAMDESEDRPSRGQLSRWFNVFLLGSLSWALFVCPQWLGSDPWMPTLGTELAAARLPILGGSLWAIATGLAILCILWRSNTLWLVNAIAFLLFTLIFLHPAIAITDQVRQQPLREMASHAVRVQKPGEAIVMIGFTKPSLVFYTQQHVEYLENPSQLQPYLAQAKAPGYLLITTPNLLAEANLKPRTYQKLCQAGVYTLVHL